VGQHFLCPVLGKAFLGSNMWEELLLGLAVLIDRLCSCFHFQPSYLLPESNPPLGGGGVISRFHDGFHMGFTYNMSELCDVKPIRNP